MHQRRLLQAKNVSFYIIVHAGSNIKELLVQDVVKLGKSIEFITLVAGGGVACV